MNKIIFTEEFCQPENLYPFSLTRQIQDIRVGILSIREKWEKILKAPSFDKYEDDYKDLSRSVHITKKLGEGVFFLIHGNIIPNTRLVKMVNRLKNGEFLSVNGSGVIFRFTKKEITGPDKVRINKSIEFRHELKTVQFPWDIVHQNDHAIREDFRLLTAGRKSASLPKTCKAVNPEAIFIEKGADLQHVILNAAEGPIYIGKGAVIMEGSLIRGPVSVGEKAVVKMGTKIYGATSIGPGCVAGGEIKNSVFFANSNKAHDGYLGDSVVGEWCNLGAGTSSSNVKNTAGEVRVWTLKGELAAGKKCGMFMGDYSKTAINTSINTGSVIGIGCNVFGAGLTPKYIPSFSWGVDGVQRYELDKLVTDIENWKKMKGQVISKDEETILKYIYNNY